MKYLIPIQRTSQESYSRRNSAATSPSLLINPVRRREVAILISNETEEHANWNGSKRFLRGVLPLLFATLEERNARVRRVAVLFLFSFISLISVSLLPLPSPAIWFRKRDGGGTHEFGATGSQPGTLAVAATAFAATVVPATPSTAATGPTVQGGPGAAPLPTTLHPRETGMGIRVGPDRQPSIRLLAELPRSVGRANLPLLRSRLHSPDDGFGNRGGGGSVTGNARTKITFAVVPPFSRRETEREREREAGAAGSQQWVSSEI